MSNTIVYPVDYKNVSTAETYAERILLPVRVSCDPTPVNTILVECDKRWNCNLKQTERPYFLPYLPGDKIILQTLFLDLYNPDPTNPADGWTNDHSTFMGADLCDIDGTLISSDLSTFSSRNLVGWSGLNSYQLLEIDVDRIISNYPTLKCWNIKIKSKDAQSNLKEVCTQDFVLADAGCQSTVVFESEYKEFDGLGNYYGGGDFVYSNRLRYWGAITDRAGSIEKVVYAERAVRTDFFDLKRFSPHRSMPPYLVNMLMQVHLSGAKIFIDGDQYRVDTFAPTNQLGTSRMFWFEVDLLWEIELNFRC